MEGSFVALFSDVATSKVEKGSFLSIFVDPALRQPYTDVGDRVLAFQPWEAAMTIQIKGTTIDILYKI